MVVCIVTAATFVVPSGAQAGTKRTKPLRLDQIQVIGTHNSYHLPPREGLLPTDPVNIAQAPLDVQLGEQNVRSFELDAYDGPDFPVFHGLITDEKTNCPTMAACLDVVAEWSREHPEHIPILILVEPKQLPTSPNPDAQGAIDAVARDKGYSNWDADSLERLDEVVRDAFGRRLLTPDEVRGSFRTLRAAILARGWPALDKVRGQVVVALNTGRALRNLFLAGHQSLEARAMFVTADERAPSAAIVKRDDPSDVTEIRRLVRQHFIVRTRADEGGVHAKLNETERRTQAFSSGAHIISTDFPVPNPALSPYVVAFPDGAPARCNPVSARKGCKADHVEET